MAMEPDKQLLDYITVIDNLMAQNNVLLQQNNALLAAILAKETILQAPQLTELTIEQQSMGYPNNLTIYPQYVYDSDSNKFYVLIRPAHLSIALTLPRTDEYHTMLDVKLDETAGMGTFDFMKIRAYKFVGFNLYNEQVTDPLATVPDYSLSCDIFVYHGETVLIHKGVLPEDDYVFPIENTSKWDFKWKDTLKLTAKNRNQNLDPLNTIYIRVDFLINLYRLTTKEAYLAYLDRIKMIL